ncbi:uncharacterized protein METZ01_LOCUS115928, partial [marine metagenome]
MRQGVADRPAQFAQAKGVQEGFHLVANPHRTVLQVPVVKTQPGINKALGQAATPGRFDLARKVVGHARDRIVVERDIADFADVVAGDIANNHCRIVLGGQAIDRFAIR